MKARDLLIAIALMCVVFLPAQAQVYIQTQIDWVDALADQPWTDNNPLGADYIIGVDENGNRANPAIYEFVVPAWQILLVEEGTVIQMSDMVSILFDGSIVAGAPGTAQPQTIFEGWDDERWGSLVFQGAASNGQFFNTTIRGGCEPGQVWPGLISLVSDEGTTTPSINLVQCRLYDSVNNGIIVCASGVGEPRVSSTIQMSGTIIGDDELPIQNDGIAYAWDIDEGVTSTLLISGSTIEYCRKGIYHMLCESRGEEGQFGHIRDGFTLEITSSNIRNNEEEGVLFVCPEWEEAGGMPQIVSLNVELSYSYFDNNGNNLAGIPHAGFEINQLPCTIEDNQIPGTESTFSAEYCHFNGNSDQGLNLWYTSFATTYVANCQFNQNGFEAEEDNNLVELPNYAHGQGANLFIRAPNCNDQRYIHVLNSTVKENGLSGLCIRGIRNGDPRFHAYVQGNLFQDNGQMVDWQNPDPQGDSNDPMEGANIHIYENIDWLVITNNNIYGAYAGIVVDSYLGGWWNGDEWEPVLRGPVVTQIYNNVQSGWSIQGQTNARYGIILGEMNENRWEGPHTVYNNVFWNNLTYGAWIRTDDIDGDYFCSNILGSTNNNQGLIGIFEDDVLANTDFLSNGLSGNQGGNYIGCAGQDDLIDDPEFVDAQNKNFHLRWSSPMINAGIDPEGADPNGNSTMDPSLQITDFQGLAGYSVDRDGSRNDMGAYGGWYAYGNQEHGGLEMNEVRSTYGWNPYCLIKTGFSTLTGTMVDDYYIDSTSCSVPVDGEFTVEEGAFVEFTSGLTMSVRGQINVGGDDPVYFTGKGTSRWGGIRMKSDASVNIINSSFDHLMISQVSTAGLKFETIPDDNDNHVLVRDCVVMNGTGIGIDILNSRVQIDGNADAPDIEANEFDPQTWWNFDAMWNSLRQIRGTSGTSMGVKISTVTQGDVLINGTKVFQCGRENRTNEYSQSGIALVDADGVSLSDAAIFLNGNTGIYISSSTPITLNSGDADMANGLRDNGLSVNSLQNGNGAELYIVGSTGIDADVNDFKDVDGVGAPRSYAVWLDANSSGNANTVYWGIQNPDNDDFVALISTPANLAHNNPVNDWNDDAKWIADISPLQQAQNLIGSGQYSEAAEILRGIISNDPTSNDAITALRLLYGCYNSARWNWEELRDYCNGLADEYSELAIASTARLMSPRITFEQRQFTEAKEQYLTVAANAPNSDEAALATIHSLEIEEMLFEGEEIASLESSRLDKISALLNGLGQSNGKEKSSLPTELSISEAYPNPFNSSVRIEYGLPVNSEVKLAVFDATGREVASLYRGTMAAGNRTATWYADGMPSGIYWCRLQSGESSTSTKLVLVR